MRTLGPIAEAHSPAEEAATSIGTGGGRDRDITNTAAAVPPSPGLFDTGMFDTGLFGALAHFQENNRNAANLLLLGMCAFVVYQYSKHKEAKNKQGTRMNKNSLGFNFLVLPLPSSLEGGHTLLFVYGTLQGGFHWNNKYLSRGGLLVSAEARTKDRFPLVIGNSGVPYVLG